MVEVTSDNGVTETYQKGSVETNQNHVENMYMITREHRYM
jgi:hypothetical protein